MYVTAPTMAFIDFFGQKERQTPIDLSVRTYGDVCRVYLKGTFSLIPSVSNVHITHIIRNLTFLSNNMVLIFAFSPLT